jgi:hypothetical protein
MILRVTLFYLRLHGTMRTLLELPEEPDLAPQTHLIQAIEEKDLVGPRMPPEEGNRLLIKRRTI